MHPKRVTNINKAFLYIYSNHRTVCWYIFTLSNKCLFEVKIYESCSMNSLFINQVCFTKCPNFVNVYIITLIKTYIGVISELKTDLLEQPAVHFCKFNATFRQSHVTISWFFKRRRPRHKNILLDYIMYISQLNNMIFVLPFIRFSIDII